MNTIAKISPKLLTWYKNQGRHALPWRQDINAYRVWLSEIMLQQTQVATVIDYFNRFISTLPSVHDLAKADEDLVLHLWSGLGYYSRARNLHKTAKLIVTEHNGSFPNTVTALESLPGIGRSTAGAIVAIAFNNWAPILDGNVKRVLARYHALAGWPGKTAIQKQLWQFAEYHTPEKNVADYTQAIMDLGATLCTRSQPDCKQCPLQADCQAFQLQQQNELPTPKPKKTIPTRHVQWLVVQDQEKLLLVKRPNKGIWGGLWCFPQCDADTNTTEWAKQNLELDLKHIEYLKPFRHTFSHFHLEVQPVLFRLLKPLPQTKVANKVGKQPQVWYNPLNADERGLAAPVSKLLTRIELCPA